MVKIDIKELLARNIREQLRRSQTIRTQKDLSKASGISEAAISEIVNKLNIAGIDTVASFANAFGVQPWELLMDGEEARRAAWAQVVWGKGISDVQVEQHLPMPPRAPKKEAAPKRKKPLGRRRDQPGSSA